MHLIKVSSNEGGGDDESLFGLQTLATRLFYNGCCYFLTTGYKMRSSGCAGGAV